MKAILTTILMLTQIGIAESSNSQDLHQIDFNGLRPYLNKKTDTIYIINFWATWCAPCLKELPELEKARKVYSKDKVQFIYVSLDFSSHIQKRLIPFINKHEIGGILFHLEEPNPNRWIDLVDPSWSGAIPATLFYRSEKRFFIEQPIDFETIIQTIEKLE